ncbi:MAG: acetate uptake transporter [Promethearchaeota archaeon]
MSEKEIKESVVKIVEAPVEVAEPAPLGLIGLAVAALVLASADLGIASSDKAMLIPWTINLGATAQLIAGFMDFKRKNLFGGTAFVTYSLLWYSVSLTLIFSIFTGATVDLTYYGFGMLGFLVFSIIMTVAALWTNTALFVVLVGIDGALAFLVPHVLAGTPAYPVGLWLVFVSAASFYTAAGVMLNTMAGRTILPLGKPFLKPKTGR